MKICNNCEGLIPEPLIKCPNCDFVIKESIFLNQKLQKIINGITISSVAMTLMACYGRPPSPEQIDKRNKMNLLVLFDATRTVTIQLIGPKDLGTLKVNIQGNEFTLEPSGKSQNIILSHTSGIYKIVDSNGKILFIDDNFKFWQNIKDGIIIKEDSYLDFYNPNICYNLNGETGKVETFNCN